MHRHTTFSTLTLLCSLFYITAGAQTTLYPGDIGVLAIATDLGGCGLPPQTDEISFFCFQDIETGTEIDLTDNGYEHTTAGYWGDGEGTLRMTRTGGTIPRGTVITLEARLVAGNWIYRTTAPDNGWDFDNLNVPGGFFNMDNGGDQVTFMQGGDWDNQGGGSNKASYSGRLLYIANTSEFWAADGTVNHSNIPPSLAGCFHNQVSAGSGFYDFVKYFGNYSEGDHFDWLERLSEPGVFSTLNNCNNWLTYSPLVPAEVEIEDNMSLSCLVCDGCAPMADGLLFQLPTTGTYNVVYTNGVDTFYLFDIPNGYTELIEVNDTISYWLISVEEVDGCTVYSNFTGQADINAVSADVGSYNEIWLCPSYNGQIDLIYFLNGTPEPGGIWLSQQGQGQLPFGIWTNFFGEGLFTYYISHGHGTECEPTYDSASVRVHYMDLSETIIEVECDQNGTPFNVYDDRIIMTLTVIGDYFGDTYNITVSNGTITPTTGQTGVPTVFTLNPGSAFGPDLTFTIEEIAPLGCEYTFDLPSPGFCSDPCDPNMTSSLVGPEDLCVFNCPFDESSITLEIEGGTPPYLADITMTSPGHPTWSFTDLDMDEYQEIRICVDTVPEPVWSAGNSLLTLPVFLAGDGILITLDQVYDDFLCTGSISNDELFISVHERPEISTDTLRFCRYDAINLDLTEYDGVVSLFLDVEWYDGDPYLGGEEIFNVTGVNLENIVDLWAYVEDDYCGNSIRVPFVILPTPDLDSIPPIALCAGESVDLAAIAVNDLGNSMAAYSYHLGLPPDTINLIDTTIFTPADSTVIYLYAQAGVCVDILPIEIFMEDVPDFALQGLPCDIPSDTYAILFESSADSVAATAGTVVLSPTGQDSILQVPNNTPVQLVLYNPTGLCTDTIDITAPNCDCPDLAQPVAMQTNAAICTGEPIPTFEVTVTPGLQVNWYAQPSGGAAISTNSLTYTPSAAGTFYAEALDPATSCTSLRTPVTLAIHPVATLMPLPNPQVCAGETVDFSAIAPAVTNGVAGSGQWFDLQTQQPVNGQVPVTPGQGFVYIFTSTNGACQTRDTIAITVNPLPDLDIDLIDCNDNLLVYNLGFTSDATLVATNAGTLIQIAGTDSFRLEDIPFNTDIVFSLVNDLTGCMNTINFEAPDCSCPPLLQNQTLSVCSGSTMFDLSTLENPGVNGSWTLEQTPPGGQPATLTGTTLQIQNADPGLYQLLFVRNVILDDCVDSAFVDLTLLRSPAADAGVDGAICAGDPINLSGVVDGTNALTNWQTTGSGAIAAPGNPVTTYTPTLADIQAGSVSFTLTATDPGGTCPAASETITYQIDGEAYYELDDTPIRLCDTIDTAYDLAALITFGQAGGQWFFLPDIPGAIQNGNQLQASAIPAGNYTLYYAPLTANPPCVIDTTGISVLIENCTCPSVALLNPPDGLCSAAGSLDLTTLELTPEPGSWSIASAPSGGTPATLNGNLFVINNSSAGIYTLRFTLTNPVNGCDEFAEVDLTVSETPTVTLVSSRCAPDLQSWEAVVQASTSDLTLSGGQWTQIAPDTYQVTGIPSTENLSITVTSGDGFCITQLDVPFPDCECTLSVSGLPASVTLCPDESVTLEASIVDPKGPATAFWHIGTDTTWQTSLTVGIAGVYTFTAIDELGCMASSQVAVEVYADIIMITSSTPVTCPGFTDGTITVEEITGGEPPYALSVNGGAAMPIGAFPLMLDNLGTGTYMLEVLDAASCAASLSVTVSGPDNRTLSLGGDQTILLGDTAVITPILSFVPDSFYWSGDLTGILPDILNQQLSPEQEQVIRLTALDENGCEYTDEIRIKVLLTSQIEVPNVFSPNGDGINDWLSPSADPSVTRFTFFEIYDRWGELVYEARDFTPGSLPGWDGTFRGSRSHTGVYVYRVEAINKRDQRLYTYGDVTVIR